MPTPVESRHVIETYGSKSRMPWHWLGTVAFWVITAAIIRLLYMLEQGGTSPLFYQPLLDEREAVNAALDVLNGSAAAEPYFKAPGYSWIMAAIMSISGDAWPWTVRGVQHLAGAWVTGMVAGLGGSLSKAGKRREFVVGLSGALAALYAPMIRLEDNLSLDFWVVFFQTAMLWVLVRWASSNRMSPLPVFAAGSLAAAAWVTRPTITLILPFLAVWVGLAAWKIRGRRWAAALFLLPVALMAGAVMVRNYSVSNESLAMPWQGGYSLYHANKPGASGRYYLQSKVAEGADANPTRQLAIDGYRESLPPAQKQNFDRSPKYKAVSDYWFHKTKTSVLNDPVDWLSLMGRKLLYMFSDKEIFNYEDFDLQRSLSSLLRWMPGRFGLVFPLALASLAFVSMLSFRRRWIYGLMWLYVLPLSGAIALYYTSGRMRMPIALPLIALAGSGAVHFLSYPGKRTIIGGLLVMAGICISWGDWWGVRSESMVHVDLARMSNAAWHRGKYDKALEFALDAENLSPDYPGLPRLKGQALYGLGRLEESEAEFQKSIEVLGDDTSRRNLQVIRDELKSRGK